MHRSSPVAETLVFSRPSHSATGLTFVYCYPKSDYSGLGSRMSRWAQQATFVEKVAWTPSSTGTFASSDRACRSLR
jgi:hypothetical protein